MNDDDQIEEGISPLDYLVLESDDLALRSPRDAWLHILRLRRATFECIYNGWEPGGDPEKRKEACVLAAWTPVNPVLLSFALAHRVLMPSDLCRTVRDFAGCETQLFLENSFLYAHELVEAGKLGAILDAEVDYLGVLMELAFELVSKTGCLIDRADGSVSIWDILWGTWLMLNPRLFHPFAESPFGKGDDELYTESFQDYAMHGFATNSIVHIFRGKCALAEADAACRLNLVLEGKIYPSKSTKIADEHRNWSRLVERGRRLYYWCPHEISAYSVSDNLMAPPIAAEQFLVRKDKAWIVPESLWDRAAIF